MGEKSDYLKLAQQCRERGSKAKDPEDGIEWTRLADMYSRVAREHVDMSRQKIGPSSVPVDEAKRVTLRRREKARTLPRRFG